MLGKELELGKLYQGGIAVHRTVEVCTMEIHTAVENTDTPVV